MSQRTTVQVILHRGQACVRPVKLGSTVTYITYATTSLVCLWRGSKDHGTGTFLAPTELGNREQRQGHDAVPSPIMTWLGPSSNDQLHDHDLLE